MKIQDTVLDQNSILVRWYEIVTVCVTVLLGLLLVIVLGVLPLATDINIIGQHFGIFDSVLSIVCGVLLLLYAIVKLVDLTSRQKTSIISEQSVLEPQLRTTLV